MSARYLGEMLIRTTVALLLVAACAEDVELNPLPEENWTRQESSVCELSWHKCDPYDPWANWHCSTVCGVPGHCLEYAWFEEDWCWKHPGSYYHGGYCSPFGEPTWPTYCVDGLTP